jgi:hypothetical protein
VAQTAEKLSVIIGLVAGGSGIAIVPESLRYMHVPSVVFRPLADIKRVSELAVAYRRDERSPPINFVLTKLREGALYKKMERRAKKPLPWVTDRGLNDMRCFRGGLTLGVHKIPFLEFFPNAVIAQTAGSSEMTSQPLTPQLGRIILARLEEPKRESAIVLEGFNPYDPWAMERLKGFLRELSGADLSRPVPEGVRTPGPWRSTALGLESRTRGDFLAEGD